MPVAFRTLYSADAAVNFIRALDALNTVNDTCYVAMPEIMTIERWADLVWRAAGHQCRIAYVPREVIRKQGPLRSYSPPLTRPVSNFHDLFKAEAAFGIKTTPMAEWIQTTVDWYRESYQGEDSEGYEFREEEVALAERWEEALHKQMTEF